MLVSITALLVFAYIWGDIRTALLIAVGVLLAKVLLGRK